LHGHGEYEVRGIATRGFDLAFVGAELLATRANAASRLAKAASGTIAVGAALPLVETGAVAESLIGGTLALTELTSLARGALTISAARIIGDAGIAAALEP
jgi:hypothetical protein